ncbi:hypothetical protein NC651_015262 [Populus alba x Populus x berolinensis]|nr:hypothetical protein NC651_015262 [Populus alba x Populus x berolinensis]
MVALRCLEDFFSHNNGITNDVPSKEPKVTFDLSESSKDVLQSILQRASLKEYSGLVDANDRCNKISANYKDLGAPIGRIDESDTDVQINAPEENSIPLKRIEVEGNSCNKNSLHFKRDRSGSANENLAGDLEDQNCVDDGDHLHP